MAISDDENPSDYQEHDPDFEDGDEDSDWNGESDSDDDSSYGVAEETRARLSNRSVLTKSRSRTRNAEDLETPEIDLPEVDEKSYEKVQAIVKAGQLEKLKVDQCKVYLRKNGLRLSGYKHTLIQRIREHLEILNGEGERKYPPSSFVLNCKGDACMGDIVMFEQNIYDMYSIVSQSAAGPPCDKRIVAGRIVKESYGAAKQQHTFTMEVLWSKGEKPLPPLHPLLIKGRNLYRLKTLRQRWKDEGERQKVLNEKHSRGYLARSDREVRVQEERRKNLKKNKVSRKEGPNTSQPPSKLTTKVGSHFQKSGISAFQAHEIRNPVSFICLEKPKPILQQPGFPLPGFTLQPSCRPQNSNGHQQPYNSTLHQLVQSPVKSSSIQEVQDMDELLPPSSLLLRGNPCCQTCQFRHPVGGRCVTCFFCHQVGHLVRDCPNKCHLPTEPAGGQFDHGHAFPIRPYQVTSGGKGKRVARPNAPEPVGGTPCCPTCRNSHLPEKGCLTCYVCGSSKHLARACPGRYFPPPPPPPPPTVVGARGAVRPADLRQVGGYPRCQTCHHKHMLDRPCLTCCRCGVFGHRPKNCPGKRLPRPPQPPASERYFPPPPPPTTVGARGAVRPAALRQAGGYPRCQTCHHKHMLDRPCMPCFRCDVFGHRPKNCLGKRLPPPPPPLAAGGGGRPSKRQRVPGHVYALIAEQTSDAPGMVQVFFRLCE